MTTEREERPEVRPGIRNPQIYAFRQLVTLTPKSVGHPLGLEVRVDGRTWDAPLGVTVGAPAREYFQTKARKLEGIEPFLRCPHFVDPTRYDTVCGGELERTGALLTCRRCGATYPAHGRYDFLDPQLRTVATADPTENISCFGYDPIAEEVVARCVDGWVLNAGSGSKAGTRSNIVNLEIADYPSTDVLGVGEIAAVRRTGRSTACCRSACWSTCATRSAVPANWLVSCAPGV